MHGTATGLAAGRECPARPPCPEVPPGRVDCAVCGIELAASRLAACFSDAQVRAPDAPCHAIEKDTSMPPKIVSLSLVANVHDVASPSPVSSAIPMGGRTGQRFAVRALRTHVPTQCLNPGDRAAQFGDRGHST